MVNKEDMEFVVRVMDKVHAHPDARYWFVENVHGCIKDPCDLRDACVAKFYGALSPSEQASIAKFDPVQFLLAVSPAGPRLSRPRLLGASKPKKQYRRIAELIILHTSVSQESKVLLLNVLADPVKRKVLDRVLSFCIPNRHALRKMRSVNLTELDAMHAFCMGQVLGFSAGVELSSVDLYIGIHRQQPKNQGNEEFRVVRGKERSSTTTIGNRISFWPTTKYYKLPDPKE